MVTILSIFLIIILISLMLWSFPGMPEDSRHVSSSSSSFWWRCYIWGSERESLLDAHHQLALLTPKWLSLDVHHHHHHHNDCDDRDDYQKLPLMMIMILSPIYQYLTQSKDIWLDQTNILKIRFYWNQIFVSQSIIFIQILFEGWQLVVYCMERGLPASSVTHP